MDITLKEPATAETPLSIHFMNNRLKHIQSWPDLAKKVNWSASALAKECRVSLRTLQRHFLKETGKGPKAWLLDLRQRKALELLDDGCTVKEASNQLGYKQASTFSREFKKFWKVCPNGGWEPAAINSERVAGTGYNVVGSGLCRGSGAICGEEAGIQSSDPPD